MNELGQSSDTLEFLLADYRFDDNSKDYIVTDWRYIDLSSLGWVKSVKFYISSTDNGSFGMNTPGYFCLDNFSVEATKPSITVTQYEGIHKDSSLIKGWASQITLNRGYLNISDTSVTDTSNGVVSNKAFFGTDTSAIGYPGSPSNIVSLGDKGDAIIEFEYALENGSGPDFAVFENGFEFNGQLFAELAFVEVSSDGINYVRFPALSYTSTAKQLGAFDGIDASGVYNLAGKHKANIGTPFDLELLKDSAGLDVDNITHVKLIDVVGNIDPSFGSFDSRGNAINDPWPTPFSSSGFDLAGVAVINWKGPNTSVESIDEDQMVVYPNPVSGNGSLTVSGLAFSSNDVVVSIISLSGVEVMQHQQSFVDELVINLSGLSSGRYILKVQSGAELLTQIITVQ